MVFTLSIYWLNQCLPMILCSSSCRRSWTLAWGRRWMGWASRTSNTATRSVISNMWTLGSGSRTSLWTPSVREWAEFRGRWRQLSVTWLYMKAFDGGMHDIIGTISESADNSLKFKHRCRSDILYTIMTLEHKISHKCWFFKIEMYASSESWINSFPLMYGLLW